jgi:thioredoxin-like negative regulator of GroEL
MAKTYGPQTINQLLLAYRDGLDTDKAIAQVCKVDKATFEKGYLAYLQGVVKALKGRPAEKPQTLAQLREANEKNPDDLDTAAKLAEKYADRGRNVDARKLVDGVLEKKKLHPLANYVRARLVLLGGDEAEARRLLEAALDPKDPEPKMVQLLGKLYFDNKQLDKAAEMFELGRKTQPAEPKWLTELIRVAAQSNDKNKQMDLMKELVKTDYDDFEQRKRLARMLLDNGKYADAEKIGREALEINILDAAVQDIVLKALEEQKKNGEAAKLRKVLER